MRIFTIGHSNTPFEKLSENLKKHGIETVIDVRSAPYSKYASHFNYDSLEGNLSRHGISYEYMGDRLGGRPRLSKYVNARGRPDYEAMAGDEQFQEALDSLLRMADGSVLCLICSEEDPARCHRSKLISAQLALRGADVMHILGDGTLEPEEANAKRRFSIDESQMELLM